MGNPVLRKSGTFGLATSYVGKRRNWRESLIEAQRSHFIMPSPPDLPPQDLYQYQRRQQSVKREREAITTAPSDDAIYGIPQIEVIPLHRQETRSTSPRRSAGRRPESAWVALKPRELASTLY